MHLIAQVLLWHEQLRKDGILLKKPHAMWQFFAILFSCVWKRSFFPSTPHAVVPFSAISKSMSTVVTAAPIFLPLFAVKASGVHDVLNNHTGLHRLLLTCPGEPVFHVLLPTCRLQELQKCIECVEANGLQYHRSPQLCLLWSLHAGIGQQA